MKVRLTAHDENWARMFADEAEFLREIFRDQILKFEHFGSTFVPGLKAKPVIDMMCIVKNIDKIDEFNGQVRSLGYAVAGEWGIPGRRLFRKGGDTRFYSQAKNPSCRKWSKEHCSGFKKHMEVDLLLVAGGSLP